MHDLIEIHVGMVKRHVIHCIRNEPKSGVPDDVLLDPLDCPDHRVPRDPADRYADPDTGRPDHPDTSKEEKTRVANTGARVTNSHTSGLNRIVRTMSPTSPQCMFERLTHRALGPLVHTTSFLVLHELFRDVKTPVRATTFFI